MKTVSHWINGSLTTDKASQVGEIFNPATGKISGTVNFADITTVNQAVQAASSAFDSWRHSSLTKRTQVLFAFRELVNKNKEKIAEDYKITAADLINNKFVLLQRGKKNYFVLCVK